MTQNPRREFVKKASLLCGVSLLATTAPQSLHALSDGHGGEDFAGLFSDPASAARISQAYLAAAADAEASAAALKAAVTACRPADGEALRSYLRDRIEADFTTGNTVILDGWVLARSEVDACLLAQRDPAQRG